MHGSCLVAFLMLVPTILESLACCVCGEECSQVDVLYLHCPLPRKESEQAQCSHDVTVRFGLLVLKKAIDGMANGVPEKVKHLKSGSISIKVDQKHQSLNLLRTTVLMNYYPVKVSSHKYLNSVKCVIQSRELNNMEE